MNKVKTTIGIAVFLLLINSFSIAYEVNDPKDHAFHSFNHDPLGWVDTTNFDTYTVYRPDMPSIPAYSIIDELYIRLEFDMAPTTVTNTMIERLNWVNSCDDKQKFFGGVNSGFHHKEYQNYLVLSYNYVDDRFDQDIGGTNLVSDPSCWELSITGTDDVISMDINVTYHQQEPNNLATSGLQDFFKPDGYVDTSGFFTGRYTLSEIDSNTLETETSCTYASGNKINASDKKSENLVVLIHGWNPFSTTPHYSNKYAPGDTGTCATTGRPTEGDNWDLEFGWYHLYKNLVDKVGDDWVIARYDWSEDAATGFLDLGDGSDFIKANQARDRSHIHGKRLGQIIETIHPKKVQLIAHSAGTWMARRSADYLREKFGNNIEIEVTVLDPFVISDNEDSFEITETWVNKAENYWVNDAIDSNSYTDVLGYTSGDYDGWDNNLQLDNVGSPTPEYLDFMNDHSGPIYWYARTVPTTIGLLGFEESLPFIHLLTKPTIETFNPTSSVISINPTFKLYFSKNMLVSTLLNAITITGSVSGNHAVSGLNYIESEFAVSFSASGDFTPDETVTVQIETSATDRNNNNLEGNNLTKVYQVEGSIIQPPPPPADAMVFFNETIADGTYFNGGDSFTKTWTLKNTGTNTWNSGYCLKHYNGDILSSNSSVCVSGSVATNQTYTFSIPMTAPASIATTKNYRDNWRLYLGNSSFGSSIWADINVRGLAAPAFNSIYEVDAHQIQLSWSALSDTNFYRLYRSTSFSGTYTEIMAAAVSSYTDSGLNASTTYFYKIKGCFDSQPSTCSGLSSAASGTTFPEAGTIAETIQTYTVSSLAVQPSDTTVLSATIYNPSGVATLNAFQFAFVLSDDLLLGAGDTILYQSPEFTLANLATQDFSYSYTIPDAMTVGNHNLLACVIYDPLGVDPVTSYCQSKVLVVSASPTTTPPIPYKPTIDYTQGASQATVSWNFSSGGIYYRLFRATSAAGTYAEIYAGSGYSHVDNSISTGTSYYYKLKSCANSLENSCSALSAYSSFNATTTATNDFFVDRLVLTTAGSQLTVKANQKYSGTSTSTLVVLMGFYLSDDTSCSTSNDTYLGNAQSTLSANDTSDREELTFSLPGFANTGTWYVCAIADYNNQIAESNESNNSDSITAATEVGVPRLRPRRYVAGYGIIDVEWDPVPGNVSYRLERGSSPNGPFDEGGYIGTATSFQDGTGSAQNLGECQRVYYRLKSCNGISSNATCSVSPVVEGYSLAVNTSAPTLNSLSDRKIKVSWNQSSCGEYTYVKRTSPSDTKVIYFDKNNESFIDYSYLNPNTSYSYAIAHCFAASYDAFTDNGCSHNSTFSSITTLASPPVDNIWNQEATDSLILNKSGIRPIVFKNKVWIFGYFENSLWKNEILSSDDGFKWKVEVQNAAFSPRGQTFIVEFNEALYMIGGKLNNSSYTKDVWKSSDGLNWTLINSNTPFPQRHGASLTVFNNKMWLIGGTDRTALDGSNGGELSDIWSSNNGINWNQVTSSAVFQKRWGHQVFVANNKLILVGGDGRPNSSFAGSLYSDIWTSDNGSDWILENNNALFGQRYLHEILKYNNKFWLFPGYTSVVYEVNPNTSTGMIDFIVNRYYKDTQIWNSDDGINWSKVTEVSSIPRGNSPSVVAFNNKMIFRNQVIVNGLPEIITTSANYGYIPTPPTGNVIITGTAIANGLITADTSGISDQYTIGEYTYQWYINGAKVDGEEGIDFDVGNLTVGTEILVRARYTNSNGDLQTLMSDSVFVTTNPIVVNFSSEIISTTYRVTPLSNTLLGYDASYSVIYSSSNTNVATVSGTDENAVINIIGLGTTTITALVTDSDNNQSSTSFTLTINQAEQQITFDAAQLSVDIVINENFQLAYNLSGNSSSQTVFSSSDSAILTVDSTGMVTLLSTGNATITVSNPGDVFYLPTSSSIDILVTENPALIEVFINGFE